MGKQRHVRLWRSSNLNPKNQKIQNIIMLLRYVFFLIVVQARERNNEHRRHPRRPDPRTARRICSSYQKLKPNTERRGLKALKENCHEIKKAGCRESGLYFIEPIGPGSLPVKVFCDMKTDGGGWTLIHQHGVSSEKFWGCYKKNCSSSRERIGTKLGMNM